MNQIRNRMSAINEEILALRETATATQADLTATDDDLSNVTRAGRHLRELGTTAHSYEGVPWVTEALGISATRWAETLDEQRLALARVEDQMRDRRKKLKRTIQEIKDTIRNLEHERETLSRAEAVIATEAER